MAENKECKWVRKSKSYPEWFIDLLVNDSDKQLALMNKLTSKTKVLIKCEKCGTPLERLVYNVVSKSTGEKVRPCMCKACYSEWSDTHLIDAREKLKENRIASRKNKVIPKEVFDSLDETDRQKLKDGLLDHHKEATFVCSKCGKTYKIIFKLRWNKDFKETYKNHCPTCSKESAYKLIEEIKTTKRYYSEEFINSLYNESDKERARNKELLTTDVVPFKCSKCGHPVIKYTPHVYNMSKGEMTTTILCPNCSPKEHSPLEDDILSFLYSITDENLILNTSEIIKNPETNKSLELDIYYPNLGVAIEVNGSYWHASEGKCNYLVSKDRQQNKFILCKEKGIHLVSIYDVDWKYNQQKVKNILSSLMSKTNRVCDNTEVRPIDRLTGKEFLIKYHLDSDSNQSIYYYGLFSKENNELLAVMSFGKTRAYNSSHDMPDYYELTRYATIPNVSIVDGSSKLLSFFEKKLKPKYLLVYSDNDYFSGDVYSKLGFVFQKYTEPDYYWFNPVGNEHLPRWQCQLKKLADKYPELYYESINKHVQNKEDYIMSELKYLKVYRTGHSVWLKEYKE